MLYSEVFGERFDSKETQQREIENLTKSKEPGFGYAVLAQLMSHDDFANNFNMVLTTNFDDMVADALYLFTNKKPLVIVHESLISYVRLTRSRALVLKLHGDALLDPKNTRLETEELDKAVKETVKRILSETGLIFTGYGGNDEGIFNIFNEIPEGGLGGGIYWVNDKLPENEFGEWLKSSDATWVKHLDFDEMMLLVRKEFDLGHPDMGRFKTLENKYHDAFINLRKKVEEREDTADKEVLEEAVEEAESEFTGWRAVELEARKYWKTEPERTETIYKAGIDKFPNDFRLLGSYAYYLHIILDHDYDRAENNYLSAIKVAPNDSVNLGNYALFLKDIRKDYDNAEKFYQRAIKADPKISNNLGNYGDLLKTIRKDYDKAEAFYQRAIEADPNHVIWLGHYANFLNDIRKEYDEAEVFYRRAIDADPNYAIGLGNYANFLNDIRKEYDEAEVFYQRAIEADPSHTKLLNNYAVFLKNIRKQHDEAEVFYQRAIEADPKDAEILSNYASFLETVRADNDNAEQYYRRAIEADPDHAQFLGNYANFLKDIRKEYDKAEEFYRRAFEADPELALPLGNYANLLFQIRKEFDKAEDFYLRALEADLEDANNLGNYAGFLLAQGKQKKGFELLEKAIMLADPEKNANLLIECRFYQYSHTKTKKGRKASLVKIKKMIKEDVRSPGWILEDSVKRAVEDRHPEPEMLPVLAKVIAEEEEAEALEKFEAWREA